jgi:hypothetical protein
MIHPIFRLIASQPQMLADHAEAYSELVAQEIDAFGARWKRRVLLGAVGLGALGVTLVLAGVAVMLWAVTPDESMRAPWALLIVPAVPGLVALVCFMIVRADAASSGFKNIRDQFAADVAMLREVSAS